MLPLVNECIYPILFVECVWNATGKSNICSIQKLSTSVVKVHFGFCSFENFFQRANFRVVYILCWYARIRLNSWNALKNWNYIKAHIQYSKQHSKWSKLSCFSEHIHTQKSPFISWFGYWNSLGTCTLTRLTALTTWWTDSIDKYTLIHSQMHVIIEWLHTDLYLPAASYDNKLVKPKSIGLLIKFVVFDNFDW